MASKKPAPKKAPTKKAATAAPQKVVAAKPSKAAPKKAATAAPKKAVKAEPKKEVKKVVSKPAPVAAKSAPKKGIATKSAKPVANKQPVKPVPQKADSKKADKKDVSSKPVASKKSKKSVPVVKKTETKAPVIKDTKKTVPAKKEEKVVKKAESKKVPTAKVSKKETKPATPKKAAKTAAKKEPAKKVIVAPIHTNVPKKIDAFKTNTFATTNLKNESGKVIAHRKTSELKRKTEETKPKKYIPELSRSILDMSQSTNTTSYRYSDEDLQEFKELIQRKLDTAKAELQYLQGVIMRRDESGTEDTENKYQNMEDGSASMDREQLNQLASRQVTFITHLEQAMVRIENKTYGICRETGKLIDKARLRAVPHATLSIEAKNAKKN